MHATVRKCTRCVNTVKDADPDSFIVVVESHEVHGEGFKMTNIGEAEN